jgi:hypothetical protein
METRAEQTSGDIVSVCEKVLVYQKISANSCNVDNFKRSLLPKTSFTKNDREEMIGEMKIL